MTDQVQIKKSDNEKTKQKINGKIAQTDEFIEEKRKADEKQKVTKDRIECLRKSFKSRWLAEQIGSLDNNKGK